MAERANDSESREERVNAILAEYLDALAAGRAPDRAELLARHPELAAELASFFTEDARVRKMAELPGSPANVLTAEPVASLAAPSLGVVRYFGDYELLEEIARGGMGVVYRARQVSLNRIVALKMILAGQFASPMDVQRFRSEAAAAGILDHPNIVPIYECLTGRPPFQAATPLDTMLQVLDADPAPPAELNPMADTGLSAIAIKCLAKEPERRYVSASALAEDLEAWLNGDPVSARPIGWVHQQIRWAVRHPTMFGMMLTVATFQFVIAALLLSSMEAVSFNQRVLLLLLPSIGLVAFFFALPFQLRWRLAAEEMRAVAFRIFDNDSLGSQAPPPPQTGPSLMKITVTSSQSPGSQSPTLPEAASGSDSAMANDSSVPASNVPRHAVWAAGSGSCFGAVLAAAAFIGQNLGEWIRRGMAIDSFQDLIRQSAFFHFILQGALACGLANTIASLLAPLTRTQWLYLFIGVGITGSASIGSDYPEYFWPVGMLYWFSCIFCLLPLVLWPVEACLSQILERFPFEHSGFLLLAFGIVVGVREVFLTMLCLSFLFALPIAGQVLGLAATGLAGCGGNLGPLYGTLIGVILGILLPAWHEWTHPRENGTLKATGS